MIQGVGAGASTAQVAIEAALKAHEAASRRIEAQLADAASRTAALGSSGASGASGASGTSTTEFTRALTEGLRAANTEVNKVDALPSEMVAGRVSDFHEIAAQIKQSELTFKFALEVRNKLIDAYRETMRMSV